MLLGIDYRLSTEAIAATTADTIEHDENLPEGPLSWLLFVITGANNGLAGTGTVGYTGSIDNDEWIDVTGAELRCLFEWIYSRFGGAVPAAADLEWGFPFELMSILAPTLNNGAPPIVGLPPGQKVWQHEVNASSSAGTEQIGWKRALAPPTHAPYLIAKTMSGLTASTGDNIFNLNLQPFPTAGFIISNGSTDYTRQKLYVARKGGRVDEVTDFRRNHLLMMHQPYSAVSISDPIFVPLDVPIVFRRGSYLELEAGAGYDGTERIVPVQFIPLTKPDGNGEQGEQKAAA